MIRRLTAIACIGALIGCSGGKEDGFKPKPVASIPPATVAPGQESTLMPLKVGNQWTYSLEVMRAQDGRTEPVPASDMTWKVTSVTPEGKGNKATIEVVQDGRVVDRQVWRINDKGIYQLSIGVQAESFSSPKPVVLFPVKDGNTFKWSGQGPSPIGSGSTDTTGKIMAAQEVDTEMGRQSAIPIETRMTYRTAGREAKSVATVWLTPGVGIVRYRQETVMGTVGSILLMKLKGSSLMRS